MTKEELLDLRLYLKSGNDIPVARVTLPADKFKRILDHIDAQAAKIQAREESIRNAAEIIGKLQLELREYTMKEQFDLAYALRKNNA